MFLINSIMSRNPRIDNRRSLHIISFLIVAVASGNRKSRHSKIKSEVTALSIAGIRVPEMKKAPSHL